MATSRLDLKGSPQTLSDVHILPLNDVMTRLENEDLLTAAGTNWVNLHKFPAVRIESRLSDNQVVLAENVSISRRLGCAAPCNTGPEIWVTSTSSLCFALIGFHGGDVGHTQNLAPDRNYWCLSDGGGDGCIDW
jgi:hypothetical protein